MLLTRKPKYTEGYFAVENKKQTQSMQIAGKKEREVMVPFGKIAVVSVVLLFKLCINELESDNESREEKLHI